MKKILIILTAVTFFLSPLYFPVSAADFTVDCPAPPSACQKSGLEPLFNSSSDSFWYPGKTVTRMVTLVNSSAMLRQWAMIANRSSNPDHLENIMTLAVTDAGNGANIWSGTIADFYNLAKVDLGSSPPNASRNLNFSMTMNGTAGDTYQGQEIVFNLSLGFWDESIPYPTSTPTPTLIPTVTNTPTPTPTPIPGPTSTPGPGPTETPAPAATVTPVPGLAAGAAAAAGGVVQQIQSAITAVLPDILGAQTGGEVAGTSSAASEDKTIFGAGLKYLRRLSDSCVNPLWGIPILLLLGSATAGLVYRGRSRESLKYLISEGLLTLAGLLFIGLFFCHWWIILTTGLIGVAGIVLLIM